MEIMKPVYLQCSAKGTIRKCDFFSPCGFFSYKNLENVSGK